MVERKLLEGKYGRKVFLVAFASVLLLTPMVFSVANQYLTIESSGKIIRIRPLHVEGRYIKDDLGRTIHLRGVTGGGWVDDYTGLWSPEGGGTLDGMFNWNPEAVKQHLDAIKSWGVNFIRSLTAVDYWKFDVEGHRQHIKDFITWSGERGIYVLFGFYQVQHYFEGGDEDQTAFPYPPYTIHSEIIANEDEFVALWADVAQELGAYPNVLFDLWNEVGGGYERDEVARNHWWDIAQRCVDAIRAQGDNIIDLEFGWGVYYDFNWGPLDVPYGATMEWISDCPVNATNLIYDTHIYRDGGGVGYWSGNYSKAYLYDDVKSAFQNMKIDWVGETLNKSLIIGETGANLWWTGEDLEHELAAFNNTFTILNEWGLGYAAWIWDQRGPYPLREYADTVTFNPSQSGQILIDAITKGTA